MRWYRQNSVSGPQRRQQERLEPDGLTIGSRSAWIGKLQVGR